VDSANSPINQLTSQPVNQFTRFPYSLVKAPLSPWACRRAWAHIFYYVNYKSNKVKPAKKKIFVSAAGRVSGFAKATPDKSQGRLDSKPEAVSLFTICSPPRERREPSAFNLSQKPRMGRQNLVLPM
jgi:hypothetical protein